MRALPLSSLNVLVVGSIVILALAVAPIRAIVAKEVNFILNIQYYLLIFLN
jgi:hypothetical protein